MGLDIADLRAFEAKLAENQPGFKVRFKGESVFMKVLGFLLYLFNPQFMDSYTTTIGKTVYFASQEEYEQRPEQSFRVLAHEFVHIWDNDQHGLWFSLSYLFPQILVVVPLAVFGVLAWPHTWLLLVPFASWILASLAAWAVAQPGKDTLTLTSPWKSTVVGGLILGVGVIGTIAAAFFLVVWWKALVLVGGLVLLAPWPALWRTKWELRGYTMSAAVVVWLYGSATANPTYKEYLIEQFVGPSYYFMSWSHSHIDGVLSEGIQDAGSGVLQGRSPYSIVYDFLLNRSLLRF